MEMKNPPPMMMTEKMPTTKPPTRSTAVSRVSSQGASVLIHERSITVLHRKDSTPLNYGGRLCAAGFRSGLCRLGVKSGLGVLSAPMSGLPKADIVERLLPVGALFDGLGCAGRLIHQLAGVDRGQFA